MYRALQKSYPFYPVEHHKICGGGFSMYISFVHSNPGDVCFVLFHIDLDSSLNALSLISFECPPASVCFALVMPIIFFLRLMICFPEPIRRRIIYHGCEWLS